MEIFKEIKTPIGEQRVKIKTILTGAERETIDNAEMQFVKTTDGKNFSVTDMEKVGLAKKHTLLDVSLASIDDDSTNCLDRLRKMYEQDYDFVYEQILDAQKKMKAPASPT